MNNLMFKIRNFMSGRNGPDKIAIAMIVIYAVFSFVKIFFRYFVAAYTVVSVLQFAAVGYAVFRIMSKDLQKRYNENFKFEQILNKWKPYTDRLKFRIQFFSTHRFRTCSGCGEFLRLKKGRGKRTVVCPKCGKELKFYFLF